MFISELFRNLGMDLFGNCTSYWFAVIISLGACIQEIKNIVTGGIWTLFLRFKILSNASITHWVSDFNLLQNPNVLLTQSCLLPF
jgi:hypothetical protein